MNVLRRTAVAALAVVGFSLAAALLGRHAARRRMRLHDPAGSGWRAVPAPRPQASARRMT